MKPDTAELSKIDGLKISPTTSEAHSGIITAGNAGNTARDLEERVLVKARQIHVNKEGVKE